MQRMLGFCNPGGKPWSDYSDMTRHPLPDFSPRKPSLNPRVSEIHLVNMATTPGWSSSVTSNFEFCCLPWYAVKSLWRGTGPDLLTAICPVPGQLLAQDCHLTMLNEWKYECFVSRHLSPLSTIHFLNTSVTHTQERMQLSKGRDTAKWGEEVWVAGKGQIRIRNSLKNTFKEKKNF